MVLGERRAELCGAEQGYGHSRCGPRDTSRERLLVASQVCPVRTRVAGNAGPEGAWGNLHKDVQPVHPR